MISQFLFQVLSRLAPFERGLYEDYVANFWCASSFLIKWKRLFGNQLIKLISFASTICGCLPSMVGQIMRPTNKGFLYGLLNSSLTFYLFSFQGEHLSSQSPLCLSTCMHIAFLSIQCLSWNWQFMKSPSCFRFCL